MRTLYWETEFRKNQQSHFLQKLGPFLITSCSFKGEKQIFKISVNNDWFFLLQESDFARNVNW